MPVGFMVLDPEVDDVVLAVVVAAGLFEEELDTDVVLVKAGGLLVVLDALVEDEVVPALLLGSPVGVAVEVGLIVIVVEDKETVGVLVLLVTILELVPDTPLVLVVVMVTIALFGLPVIVTVRVLLSGVDE